MGYRRFVTATSLGNDISEDITDLSNSFVTSEGEDLFDVLFKAFGRAKDDHENVEIKQL